MHSSEPATISRGKRRIGKGVVIYATGGAGKTTLASFAPNPVFLDIENSANALDVARVEGIRDWDALRGALQNFELLSSFESAVLDSGTRGEDYSQAWTIRNVPHEKGKQITRIEDYGYVKGFQHNYDTFKLLLSDADRLKERGMNFVMICHECIADVPNPDGENFIAYAPRLQPGSNKGAASIRNAVFEWADTVAYIAFDAAVKDGKAVGSGTRTIYFEKRPKWLAKHRGERIAPMAWNNPENDGGFWKAVLA